MHNGKKIGFMRVKNADEKQEQGGEFTLSLVPAYAEKIIRVLFV